MKQRKQSILKHSKIFKYFVIILAALVIFTTTYSLILPAITIDSNEATEEAGFFNGEEVLTDSSDNAENLEMSEDVGSQTAETPATDVPVEVQEPAATNAAEQTEAAVAYPAMAFEADVTKKGEQILSASYPAPANSVAKDSAGILVKVEAEDGAFPEGTSMKVEEVSNVIAIQNAVAKAAKDQAAGSVDSFQAVNITFYDKDGNEIQPAKDIKVTFVSDKIKKAQEASEKEPLIVHIEESGTSEIVKQVDAETLPEQPAEDELIIEAGHFSVYAIVYTVDFYYSTYEYSIPGGETIALSDLVEVLGVLEGSKYDTADAFINAVQNVEFTNPALVQVTQVEGDWALESLQPFDTEETLTVTMKDGEVITIQVKDAQMSTLYLSDSGELYEVTVTYDETAQIPEGSKLVVTEFDNTSEEYLAAWDSVMNNANTSTSDSNFSENDTSENGSGSFSLTLSNSNEETEEPIVVADNVVPSTSGMTAFDLSIYDAEGNSVEPQAAVDVSIRVKELPQDVGIDVLESSLAVQHLNESTGELQVETVASVDEALPGEIEIQEDSITADFTVDSFSTYTITWGGGLNGQQISNISSGDYIIYAQDASDGNYYALVPSTNAYQDLTSVQLTYENGQLSYSGNSNLYWHVNVGNSYQIYYRSGNRNYYLYPVIVRLYNGDTSNLRVRTDSYSWNQYNNHLYSGQDTFLRSNNGTFQVWNVSYDSNWQSKTNIFFARPADSKTVTVHYGYMENGVFHEFDALPTGAQTSYGGPTGVGDQLDLRYDIDGYEYVTSRLESPNGTDISNLLNTDSSSGDAWKYRELTDNNEYHTWNVGDKAYDYNAATALEDDVYVIYRKAVRTSSTIDPSSGQPLDIEAPKIEKQKQDNGDGTYDIDLSVTGQAASNKKTGRANVVVVLDTSNSMKEIVDGQTKWKLATDAIKTLSTELLGLNATSGDSGKVEFTFVNFSNYVKNEKWIYSMGNDNKNQHIYNTVAAFNNMIDGLDREVYGGGTCWDKAMAAASSILWNDNDPVYVVFVSDGDTISRAYANGRYDYWDGGTYCQDYSTDYNDSTKIVKENVDAATAFADKIKAAGGTVYTIGITGGGSLENLYRLNQGSVGYVADPVAEKLHFDATDTQGITNAFESIKKDILSTLGYENVVVTDGLTGMTHTALVNGHAGNFTYTVAKYTEDVQKLTELPAGKALGSTKDADGNITSYSRNTGSDSVTYPYIQTVKTVVAGSQATVTKNNNGTLTLTFPDDTSDTVNQASYNTDSKTVTWNFGEDYQLRDGYTYTVTFTVWPNQASYDLLAALRNGLLTWGRDYTYTDESGHEQTITFADYSDQIDRVGDDYALRSNVKSGNTVTYYKVLKETLTELPEGASIGTTTDPQTGVVTIYTRNNDGTYTKTVKTPGTLDFVNPEPMPLAGTQLAMTKVWNDSLDRGHLEKLIADAEAAGKTYSVTLIVSQNGKEYKRYTFQPVKKYYTDAAMTTEAEEGVTTEYFKYIWPSQSVAIAPALLVSDPPEGSAENGYKTVTYNDTTYYVLNEGHSYTIDETDTDFHFEFIADPYYPTLIDSASELTNMSFETNADGSIKNGSTATKSGDGTLESFTANNSLTAELDITKKINDPKDLLTTAQEDAETFTYKVTLTVPKDTEANHLKIRVSLVRFRSWAFHQDPQTLMYQGLAVFFCPWKNGV